MGWRKYYYQNKQAQNFSTRKTHCKVLDGESGCGSAKTCFGFWRIGTELFRPTGNKNYQIEKTIGMKRNILFWVCAFVISVTFISCSSGKKITASGPATLRDAYKNDFLIG